MNSLQSFVAFDSEDSCSDPSQALKLTHHVGIDVGGENAFEPYAMTSVNNSPFFDYDKKGRLHFVWVNDSNEIVLQSEDAKNSSWSDEVFYSSSEGYTLINPSLRIVDGDFHIAWLEWDKPKKPKRSKVMYAKGNGHEWDVRELDEDTFQPKYLAFTVAGSGDEAEPLIAFTTSFGLDEKAYLYNSRGRVQEESLQSGLTDYLKSSDVALDSIGDRVILTWEEELPNQIDGPGDFLVFQISEDKGVTWSDPAYLLGFDDSGEFIHDMGGDPSICLTDEAAFIAYQMPRNDKDGSGPYAVTVVAGMPTGGDHFSVIEFDGDEYIGAGWLPSIDCEGNQFTVAWESSKGRIKEKGDDQIEVAYGEVEWSKDGEIADLDYILGPLSGADINDQTIYDVVANVSMDPNSKDVNVFWTRVDLKEDALSIHHREDEFGEYYCR